MKRKILGGLAAAAMLAGGLAITMSAPAAATQEVCGPLDSGKIDTSGDPTSVTVTAPEGKLIDGYCVKAGSDQSTPDGAVKYVRVDPARKTVTITHYTGKAVSHYSVSYTDAPPPTTEPPPVTTLPPPVTTLPPPVTTVPPPVTTQPPPVTTVPPPVTTTPPPVTTDPPNTNPPREVCEYDPALAPDDPDCVPPTTVSPIEDECYLFPYGDGKTLPAGEFVFTDEANATGTHSISGTYCGPTPTTAPPPPATPTQLPETGAPTGLMAAIAALMLGAGGAVTFLSRRRTA